MDLSLRSYSDTETQHQHDHYQWVFPLQGGLYLDIEHQETDLGPMQAACIKAGDQHGFHAEADNQSWVVDIAPDTLAALDASNALAQLEQQRFITLSPQQAQHVLFLQQAKSCPPEFLRHWLGLMLLSMAAEPTPAALPRRIQAVLSFIEQHLAERLSMGDLARVACLSESQLRRQFGQYLGVSPKQYLMSQRLKRAEAMMRTTDMNMSAVAQACGFSDQAAMRRAFRHCRHTSG